MHAVPDPEPKYNLHADLDKDGDVDWADFGKFVTNYGIRISCPRHN